MVKLWRPAINLACFVVSRNGIGIAQNKVSAFFVCSFPIKEKNLIWRNHYSDENKGAHGGKI